MDRAPRPEGPPLPTAAHIFFNTEQAAAYLGITARMVRRAREKGDLATTRLGGSRAWHTPEQLEAWVASCTTPAKTRPEGEAV